MTTASLGVINQNDREGRGRRRRVQAKTHFFIDVEVFMKRYDNTIHGANE